MKGINEFISLLDYAVVVGYLLLLIGIGYWISFRKKKNKDETLFLAGNSLGATSIGLTMWGTNVGPSMLIASCSIGYTTGVVAGNFSWLAFPFLMLLAFVFAPRYLQAKTTTLPEFMGKRFGNSTRDLLAWYACLTTLISWLGLTLFAGSIIVQQILELSFWVSAVILVLISLFFTIAGGLEAIAYTNVFQMILLIVASLILTVLGVHKAGGLMNIYESTPPEYWNLFLPVDDPSYPWIALILGYPIMGVWFWCTEQSMVQSVLGAKNLKNGQLGTNLTGWLKILDVVLFILPGIACYVLFPNLDNPDEAYMTMVTQLLPVGLVGLIMAVIIAALISTIDSALNSLSTVFTMDIYVRKFKPKATNKEIVQIGRIVALAGGAVAIFIALGVNSLKGLNLFDIFQAILGFLAPPLTTVFLFGVLWKKTTTKAANFTLSIGTLISLGVGVLYLWVFPKEQYDFWPHFLLVSFYIFCLLSVLAWAITIVGKGDTTDQVFDVGKTPSPSVKVKVLWGALVIVMIGLYILLNGHGGDTKKGLMEDAPIENVLEEKEQLIEIVLPTDATQADVSTAVGSLTVPSSKILKWKNRILLTHIQAQEAPNIAKKAAKLKLGEILVYDELIYDFNRSWCKENTQQVSEINEYYITTNMVADTAMQAEYIRLHTEQQTLWPGVGEGFCDENFQYITMYKNDRRLILIAGIPAEMDLYEMSRKNAENHPKVQEWNEHMAQFQEELPEAEQGAKWVLFSSLNSSTQKH